MKSPTSGTLWPPPAESPLPEPMASSLHAYVLARLRTPSLGFSPPPRGPLELTPARWRATLGHQLARAARGDQDLREGLLQHLRLIGLAGRGTLGNLVDVLAPTPESVSSVLVDLVIQTGALDEGELLEDGTQLTDDEWLSRWAAREPVDPPSDGPEPTGTDLIALRLAMGELEAVAEVVGAAGGGSLHAFTSALGRFEPVEPRGLVLDERHLEAAYPELDTAVLVRRTEVALWLRHLYGCLSPDDIEALALVPADHPCGIDLNATGSRDLLLGGGWVLTGRDVAVPMMVEWGRHRFFDWDEDEELLFSSRERPALEATLADPWCIKHDEAEGYLERL